MRFFASRRFPAAMISLALVSLALPNLALAHPGHQVDGFIQGVLHPLGGLDHLLAMVAVGLLGGRIGGRATWVLPLTFMALLTAGVALGLAGVALPMAETGIAASIIVFGLLLALPRHVPTLIAAAAVGFFALFHGHAHGTEAPGDLSGVNYAAGMLTSSALLHAAGVLAAIALLRSTRRYGEPALRTSGGLVALAGIGVLAGLL